MPSLILVHCSYHSELIISPGCFLSSGVTEHWSVIRLTDLSPSKLLISKRAQGTAHASLPPQSAVPDTQWMFNKCLLIYNGKQIVPM